MAEETPEEVPVELEITLQEYLEVHMSTALSSLLTVIVEEIRVATPVGTGPTSGELRDSISGEITLDGIDIHFDCPHAKYVNLSYAKAILDSHFPEFQGIMQELVIDYWNMISKEFGGST